MRIGQTSLVHFLSEFVASVVGFVATVYFARVLGADGLGVFFLAIAVVSWLKVVGQLGITKALTKRISEGSDEAEFATAGLLLMASTFAVSAVAILVLRNPLNDYVGYPVVWYVLLLLLTGLLLDYVHAVLRGEHLVHVSAILSPIQTFTQSVAQIALIVSAFGLAGLFIGHAVGTAIAVIVGVVMISASIQLPSKEHYRDIVSFAKYAWLGAIRGRVFNWVDILVLGFFVSNALVGIYSVAWRLVSFLMIFSNSISTALFPNMSNLSAEGDLTTVSDRLENGLAFTGLFLIPGFVGGTLLAADILAIYGQEFREGAEVLSILIAAGLVHGYQHQFLNTLNAIDHPESAFRVNLVFIVLNVVLNVVLVYLIGWVGAAIATLVSITISAAFGFYALSRYVEIQLPTASIGAQLVAALLMGIAVFGVRSVVGLPRSPWIWEASIALLIAGGAGVYFLTLVGISARFRNVLRSNLPTTL